MNNDRYPIMVQAVKMLESGQTQSKIVKELHVSFKSLRFWYARYKRGGELALLKPERISQKNAEEKVQIIKEILKDNIPLRNAEELYDVPQDTLKRWLDIYEQHGEGGLNRKNAAGSMSKKKVYTEEQLDELEKLRQRNEYLEAENALLKKVKALVEEKEARLRAIGRRSSKD